MVHGAADGLTTAAALLAATLAVLSLRTVLLIAASTTALSAPATAEIAASATAIALTARLLGGLTCGNRRSVTAGLWWGRSIRLFREIRFVVHYFLRYGGQIA
jgi:hypothetical protein